MHLPACLAHGGSQALARYSFRQLQWCQLPGPNRNTFSCSHLPSSRVYLRIFLLLSHSKFQPSLRIWHCKVLSTFWEVRSALRSHVRPVPSILIDTLQDWGLIYWLFSLVRDWISQWDLSRVIKVTGVSCVILHRELQNFLSHSMEDQVSQWLNYLECTVNKLTFCCFSGCHYDHSYQPNMCFHSNKCTS